MSVPKMLLALFMAVIGSAPVAAPAQIEPRPILLARGVNKVKLNFENAEVATVAKEISMISGFNFIVDPGAGHRRLTIITTTPVTPGEAFQAFQDALEGAGLEIVEKGSFLRIRLGESARTREPTGCPTLQGIQKKDETTWQLPGNASRLFDRPRCALVQARVVPYLRNGKPAGFKIYGIRRNSLWHQLGLQNGDVIQRVNGMEINSPDNALEAYHRFKDAAKLVVELQRRGQPRKFTYLLK